MCSYCGCRAITVVRRLTEEHELIINILGDVLRNPGSRPAEGGRSSAQQLAELLAEHTRFEEQGLFAELEDDDVLGPHVARLHEEHAAIDALLARVRRGNSGAAGELEHLLRRHIDREENGLFPAAAIALDGEAWDRAGGA